MIDLSVTHSCRIEKEYCDISEERLSHTDKEGEQMNIFQMTKEGKNSDKTGD